MNKINNKPGGIAIVNKYGQEYMRNLGRKGGNRLHELYRMVPVNLNQFVFVRKDN